MNDLVPSHSLARSLLMLLWLDAYGLLTSLIEGG